MRCYPAALSIGTDAMTAQKCVRRLELEKFAEQTLTMSSEVWTILIPLQLGAPPDVAETDRSPVARFIQTSEHDDIIILLYNLATIDAGPKRPVLRLAYITLPGRWSDVPVSRSLPIGMPSSRSCESRQAG